MARPTRQPTGKEVFWPDQDIIVSKTDPKGIITYANRVFCTVAGYSESELVGQNHNCIRHPDMPRCVFKFLWDTVDAGNECFAYVVNQARSGDHYWVLAHVTPTFDRNRKIIGYHSSRRVPRREPVETMAGIYKLLREEEAKHASPKDGLNAGMALLVSVLKQQGVSYERFIFSL